MDINKVIFAGIKVAIYLLLILIVVYSTMRASNQAYEYGYRYAVESMIITETEGTGE